VLVEERRQRVLDLVSHRGFISLNDLVVAVQASESTLRRDLDYWHQQGLLKRTHGGAIFVGDGTTLPPLEERSARQLFLGGYVYPKTGVALGPLTTRMLEDIHVNQAILSVSGVTAKGLFNSNLLLVETEKHMMRCADEVVVVVDHTKIGRPALAYLCELSAIDTLIVDPGLSAEQRHLLAEAGPRLIVAGEVMNHAEEFHP
jgi:DeoR family transcriptional regulator, fructose operon transcriptional repressor